MNVFELGLEALQSPPRAEFLLPKPEVKSTDPEIFPPEPETVLLKDMAGQIDAVRKQVEAAYTSVTDAPAETIKDSASPIPGRISARAEKRETSSKLTVRKAQLSDIDAIVALDLKLFRGAYGEETPTEVEVREIMMQRWQNAQQKGGFMHVQEQGGLLKGFITTFRTNKSAEAFESWEDSTHDGTLDGVVDPDGKYTYVTNLTVGAGGSKEQLIATALAQAIVDGVDYAYFTSRLPLFRLWAVQRAREQGTSLKALDKTTLNEWALTYVSLTDTNSEGNEIPHDYELRIYEAAGFERGKVCPEAFQDAKSLNYGVVFKVPVAFNHTPKPIRYVVSKLLKIALRFPKILEKI